MSHQDANPAETTCNADHAADSAADAKSVIALIFIVVLTVCFWLIGR